MINANLTGNFDYDTEVQALDRKRQLANLLTMASMRGINPSRGSERGGYVVPYQSSEGMAKIAQALSGALGTYAADKQQQDLAQSRNQALADAYSSGEGGMPDEAKVAIADPEGYRAMKLAQMKAALTNQGGAHLVNTTPVVGPGGKQVLLQALSTGETRIAKDENGEPYIVNPRNLPQGMMVQPDESGQIRINPYPGAPESVTRMEAAKEAPKMVEVTLGDGRQIRVRQDAIDPSLNPSNPDVMASAMRAITMAGESMGNESAVSPKGAKGSMQVMPATQSDPGYGVPSLPPNAQPEQRTEQGMQYLDALRTNYGGDPVKAWAAYNAGPGTVDSLIKKHGDNWLAYAPNETKRYVSQNIARLNAIGQSTADKAAQEQAGALPGKIALAEKQAAIETAAKAEQERQSAAIKQETVGPIKVAEQVGEAQGKARVALPKDLANAEYSMDILDKVLNHPGLSGVVGVPNAAGALPIPGTKEASFKELLKQVQGRTFLQAYETLKGGGQISEIEGEKAQQALARLGTAQTEEDFKDAVKEMKGILEKGMRRAKEMAGQPSQLDQLRDNMPPPDKRGFKLSPGQQKQADEMENQYGKPPRDPKEIADEIRKRLGL